MTKKVLELLLILSVLASAKAADTDWRKAASELMAAQEFAPIEIKPGARTEADAAGERWAWMQRVLMPHLEKHLSVWPDHADAARSFAKQALMVKAGHPDVDPSRPWDVLEKEGAALAKAHVEEPLVLYLTARAIWNSREGYNEARDCVRRARQQKTAADYPSVLAVMLNELEYDMQQIKTLESLTKNKYDHYQEIMKSAPDPAVYGPQDDRLLLEDLDFVFIGIKDRADELKKLCETPHFSPWLREMLLGRLESQTAKNDGGGEYNMKEKGRSDPGIEEHQVRARNHFLKAWELRPDHAAAAACMIDIVKTGYGRREDTARAWFDRALSAECDYYPAYLHFIRTQLPRWGGSLEKMQACFCAFALTGRDDSTMTTTMWRLLDYFAENSNDIRDVISKPTMQQTVLHYFRSLVESKNIYRVWEKSWRQADLGLLAWAAGDYTTAYETLRQVPVPLPRQTRRKLPLINEETEVRGESMLFAFGMREEWEAATEKYQQHQPTEALQICQDLIPRFQGEPPQLLLERVAACKFEHDFATGRWVPVYAGPELAEWHPHNGSWVSLKSGTLVNNGTDAPSFIRHNGRTGANFELMGEYEVKGFDPNQGLSVVLGYQRSNHNEDFITCTQWHSPNTGALASMLRIFYSTPAPQVVPPVFGRVWKFHILCRNSAVTYRLNHRDIVVDHHTGYQNEQPYVIPEDSSFGFFNRFFDTRSHTFIRHLKIRRLDAPDSPESDKKDIPKNLAALRAGFQEACRRSLEKLETLSLPEAEEAEANLSRSHKEAEAGKVHALVSRLKSGAGIAAEDMPAAGSGEDTFALFLKGFRQSVESRLRAAQVLWKAKALAYLETAESKEEAEAVKLFVSAELEDQRIFHAEEPLAAANAHRWLLLQGKWEHTEQTLTGSGDSKMLYELNRPPPFQLDFEIKVIEGKSPQLLLDKVGFAGLGSELAFGLRSTEKGEKTFPFELNRNYHVTIKATALKTELLIDGAKVSDGPAITTPVRMLHFRAGDSASRGKAEFYKIHISPLP